MEKTVTSVRLYTAIIKFCKQNNINLSAWINKSFMDRYLSAEAKQLELDFHLSKAKLIEEELNKLNSVTSINLTAPEKKYFETIPYWLSNPTVTIEALHRRFNFEFKKDFTEEEFAKLAEYYSGVTNVGRSR